MKYEFTTVKGSQFCNQKRKSVHLGFFFFRLVAGSLNGFVRTSENFMKICCQVKEYLFKGEEECTGTRVFTSKNP